MIYAINETVINGVAINGGEVSNFSPNWELHVDDRITAIWEMQFAVTINSNQGAGMAEKQTPILVTRGNDITLTFHVATSVPITLAKLAAKLAQGMGAKLAPIGPEIIIKTVTTNLSADGQITVDAPPLAMISIVLTKDNTSAFTATKDYQWDLELFDASGKATTPCGGAFTAFERVRTATG